MIRALALKEIRECLVVLIVGLGVLLFYTATYAGFSLFSMSGSLRTRTIAFVYPQFVPTFVLLVGAIAIVLGLKQSVWEFDRTSCLFLLHRPVQRWRLIGTKLVVGTFLLTAVCAAPIIVLGLWASLPGNQAAPFFWSMTQEAWRATFSVSIIYFGAFLSGIRPARWYGTRVFPVLGAIVCALLIQVLPAWWLLGVTAIVVIDLILTETIMVTANCRDYA